MNNRAERGARGAGWTREANAEIRQPREPHAKGFTLLEVLMALSILAVLVTAVFASFFTAGRNVEQAEARRDSTDLARTLIAKLCDDIANAYYNQAMKETIFYARASALDEEGPRFDSLSLTTLTNWRKPDSREMDLWEVGYRFEQLPDGKGNALYRREKRELGNDDAPLEGGTEYELSERIAGLRLRYYDGSAWLDEWDSRSQQKIPKAVEIRLTLADGAAYVTHVEAGRDR